MRKTKSSSRPRHSFSAEDRARSAAARQESPKTIHFAEAKRLLCDRLRDKNTDARSFVKLFLIYSTKFHKLTRKPRKNESEPDLSLEEMVQKIEAGELDPRSGGRLRVMSQ